MYNVSYFSEFWGERVTVDYPVTKEEGEKIIHWEKTHQTPDLYGNIKKDYRLEKKQKH